MAVYVTGDIHGNPVRLSKDSFYEQKDFSGNKVVHHDNRSCKDFCNGVNQVVADVLLQCSAPPVDGSYYNPDQEAVQQHSDQGKDDEGNEFDFFVQVFFSLKDKFET